MWRDACLRNPFSPFSFWNSKASTPPESRSTPHQLYIIASFPNSLQLKKKTCLNAEKQRVWSQELWFPKIVTIYWLCSSITTGNKAFSLRGLEAGLWAFWLQMFATCDDMLCFRSPFPPFLFGIPSLHSVPEAGGSWERQHAPSALHYGCIMIIPWLQQQQKKTSLMQRSKGFGHGVVVS